MCTHPSQPLPSSPRVWRPGLLLVSLLFALLGMPSALFGQARIGGVCPQSCGIKLSDLKATLTEAPDGVKVNAEWKLEQTNPEIKLKELRISARVKLGLDTVEGAVTTDITARNVTVKVSRRLEFDVKDVKAVSVTVTAFANPKDPVTINTITSREIIGDGRDAAVEVKWSAPGVLSCSANVFEVTAAAKNEKGDGLSGRTTKTLDARQAKVELGGRLNKKGLNSPEATLKVIHHLIECVETKNNTSPDAAPAPDLAAQAKVTLTKLAIQEDGSGRADTRAEWSVAEPTGFKATSFNLKFETEEADGKITSVDRFVAGDKRSAVGLQVAVNTVRRLTVTIIATFQDNAKAVVLTREDKKSQTNAPKQISPPIAPPAAPPGIKVTDVSTNSSTGNHRVSVAWQVQLPAGATVGNFDVKVVALKTKSDVTVEKSATFGGTAQRGILQFSIQEIGAAIRVVQVNIIANLKLANGNPSQLTVKHVVPGPPNGIVR